MKKQSVFVAVGIVMLGAVMRVPITAIPPILTDIASSLGVSVSELGLLTSIPLLMFALCSSIAPKVANRFGMERLMSGVLLTMAIGSLLRIVNLPFLYLGTILVGATIAMINVLLPSIVAASFPHKIGLYTTLYITMMGLMSTVASMVAVPIVAATSWSFFIILVTGFVGLAFLFWLPNMRQNHHTAQTEVMATSSLWKNKYAVIFLVFSGLQSMLFYTELTWLPTMAQTAGLAQAQAGFLAGIFSLVSIPVSMVIPGIVSRLKKEQRAIMMTGLSCLTLMGLVLMLFTPTTFIMWLIIHLLLGLSVSALFPYMMLSLSLKTSNSQATARLSGMVQTGGYLIAAIGPAVLGYSYSIAASWVPLIISLLLVTLGMIVTIFLIEKEDVIV
ncbi:MFS transporter [Streptococcus sp. zg-86]|uniref:MFS transporter n=1 Tax=Streptococcus zhangguiae TaxID=2664091 RepID=A0A6I4RR11_9STRE|nr:MULTISPECIES: MFS transporter [unclassified Streptococcus]MTB64558.1 MFS transporter [Streptococcus sp. zg-86]MTB90752.1 MFS transporter [Streptococcus sp. zg-36]MWV56545.1 MFS transporter [Streptococcus sp. zg-70]QTH47249.1 MFS transporter [Streptococcus sp. zg-86]